MRLKPLHSVEMLYVCASMTRPDEISTGAQLAHHHRFLGYSKIAVHYVIERDGTVYPGRPLNQPGVLAGDDNARAWQVCLLGGVNESLRPANTFTKAQRVALRQLVADVGKPVVYAADYPGAHVQILKS